MEYITKDTTLNGSFAANPSNVGTRFHNYLYENLGLPFVYKAFSPVEIKGAVTAIRALPMRGAAVSMPFKEQVIELIDEMDKSATAIQSVNTIVNDNGKLTGYNTDYSAVKDLVEAELVPVTGKDITVVIQGSGGMAKAVTAAFKDAGFTKVTILARNEKTGNELAKEYGFEYTQKPISADVLVNVTPKGMSGKFAEELAFAEDLVKHAKFIFDVVAYPPETPLIKLAKELNKPYISGDSVHTLQSVEQFVLYTGKRPDAKLIQAARTHAARG
ncbi:MAG: shikimate 5-dehydrogenase [Micrococcaceae bacterium]